MAPYSRALLLAMPTWLNGGIQTAWPWEDAAHRHMKISEAWQIAAYWCQNRGLESGSQPVAQA